MLFSHLSYVCYNIRFAFIAIEVDIGGVAILQFRGLAKLQIQHGRKRGKMGLRGTADWS